MNKPSWSILDRSKEWVHSGSTDIRDRFKKLGWVSPTEQRENLRIEREREANGRRLVTLVRGNRTGR